MIPPVRFQLRNAPKTGRVSLLTPYPLKRTDSYPGMVHTPFTPPDISDLSLWLDGADATTIRGPNSAMTGWDDKSGQANNALTAGVGTVTYSPGMRYVTTSPAYNSYFYCPLTFIRSLVPNASVFIVYRWPGHSDESTQDQVFWGCDVPASSNRHHILSYNISPSQEFAFNGGATTGAVSVAGMDNAGVHLYNANLALNATNGSSIYLNKVSKAVFTETAESSYALGNYTLYFASGHTTAALNNAYLRFHEIIIYTKTLTTAERTAVENYLYTKWAI